MKWLPIASKMFLSAGYDAGTRILYLRFRSGDVYRYFDFAQAEYEKFLQAESHGRYFLSHIRESFRYERMAKLRAA